MDKTRLSVAIYKRMGLVLGPDDPGFALVEMNRLVLEEMIDEAAVRLARQLNALPERIESCTASIASELASQGVQRVVEMMVEARRTLASDAEKADQRIAEQTGKASKALERQVAAMLRVAEPLLRGWGVRARWFVAGAVLGAAAFSAGVVAGEWAAIRNASQQTPGR